MFADPVVSSSGAVDAVGSSIDSLKAVYAVLLTLSLGEAFGQMVESNDPDAVNRKIRWDRITSLVPFLFLLIPFIHGMDRYFFETYKTATAARPASYGGHLLLDCMAFTLEGGLFFVLARSLSKYRWRRFYLTVITLLALDSVWGVIVWLIRRPSTVQWWLILDVVTVALISLTFIGARNEVAEPEAHKTREIELGRSRVVICLVIIIARTVADYCLSWHYYFPS
jgi:hypothetical protein